MRLLISYSGVLGGAERVLIEVAEALGGECCLACPPGALADAASARGLRVLPLRERPLELRGERLRAVARVAAHAREARSLIRSLDPELTVAWGMRSAIAVWLARAPRGAPFVVGHCDFLPGPAIGALVRAAARSAERVLVLSDAIASDLDPAGRLGDRIVVVHPGVEPPPADGPPARPPEVLVLGALVPWKRPDLALEALALARAQMSDLRLRFVGGPLTATGEQLAASLRRRATEPDLAGAVEFTGPVVDPWPELARASALLHCAPREPFGLVLVEALAAGRPVVAPAAGGPAEIVDESCGVLYAPGDAHAAADALLRVLEDGEAMGAAGRVRAREHFDRQRARAAFASALLPVARPRQPPGDAAGGLALVTVTHNSAAELDRLLRSVERHLPGVSVVVVDSGSEEVPRVPENVTLIELGANAGFGSACNRGVEAVTEPVIALVNPDVELLDGSLLELADEVLKRDALFAPLVLSPDGSRQDTVHPLPCSPADLTRAMLPTALVAAPWRARDPRRVGWAVGCALVARTETLKRLGPFDERIFLYGEDLDLGLRAREAGIETWFWPRAKVAHTRAHASTRAFGGEPFERLARARHDVVARRLGRRRARLDDAAQTLTFASRRLLKRALGRPAERERRQLDALRAVRHSS